MAWSFTATLCGGAQAAPSPLQSQAPSAEIRGDAGWPRTFVKDQATVTLHQPQVDDWTNYSRIKFRCAIQVALTQGTEGEYGLIEVEANTRVDKQGRLVVMTEPRFTITFPFASEADASRLTEVAREVLPAQSAIEVSLDRVLACLDPATFVAKSVDIGLDPPPIHYADSPSALLVFLGKPRFRSIDGTSLLYAVNTNWDVIRDAADGKTYVRQDRTWYVTTDVTRGPFEATATLPAPFQAIPKDENWSDVRAAIPPQAVKDNVGIIPSLVPAELIVTDGPPEYVAIGSTALLAVVNTDATIILHGPTGAHYFLVAGRWFRSTTLQGPWQSATFDLPREFEDIPADGDFAYVRSSVPGTAEATHAAAVAAVPEKATVSRAKATVQVVYDGEPKFVPIETTAVSFATNTVFDVFAVAGRYYCCHQGVWFTAASPNGPWSVCASVPAEIYSIPPAHPAHHVTYVYVYDATPDTVTVGCTSGYRGEYVFRGLLLFGAGMLVAETIDEHDDYLITWHYHAGWFSYGCGAIYHGEHGGYVRVARHYGPHGGAGSGAVYNPVTGGWARGAYVYGPAGAAHWRAGYNPWTDTARAHAGVTTPYGSLHRGIIVRDDEWVRGGAASTWRGSAGWVETSRGASGVRVDPNQRDATTVVKDDDGNIYVGRDGTIYKRDENGQWQRRDGSEWKRADPPDDRSDRPATTNEPDRRAVQTDLDKQFRARDLGNDRSRDFSRSRGGGGGRRR